MSDSIRIQNLQPNLLGAGVTANGNGVWQAKQYLYATFHAVVVGTGAVAATVDIQGSNDGVYACSTSLGTITLSGTTSSSDGFTSSAPWPYIRAVVSGISGTGATVTCTMGV